MALPRTAAARNCESLWASVDEDVHATADREVGVTLPGWRSFPTKIIVPLWGLILRKEIAKETGRSAKKRRATPLAE